MKQTYIGAAQAIASTPVLNRIYSRRGNLQSADWRTWLASLGAIYHLERMINLDIPWWNVKACQEVGAFLTRKPDARVFEYGSGASTMWVARRAGSITTVEHDTKWAKNLQSKLNNLPNANVILSNCQPDGLPDESYIKAIDGTGSYDLIIIDGRRRTECLTAAISHLNEDGIILFDDSGRRRYRSGIENCGLVERRHFGLSYCVPYPDHSSLLTRAS